MHNSDHWKWRASRDRSELPLWIRNKSRFLKKANINQLLTNHDSSAIEQLRSIQKQKER